MTDFKKLKVVELRAELASRGLTQTGKRDELIERLEEYEFEHGEPPVHQDDEQDDKHMDVDVEEETEIVPVEPAVQFSPITEPSQEIVPEQSSLDLLAQEEEEKRLARAKRFGLDESERAQVKIEVTIKRLEHALPSRSHGKHHRHHHKQQHRMEVNKP